MNLNIPESEKTPLVIALLEIINEQCKEIETLKEEILKFKKETIKPKIKKSKLNDDNKDDINIVWQHRLWSYTLDRDPNLLYDLLNIALIENSHNEVIKDKILRLMDKYDQNNNLFLP